MNNDEIHSGHIHDITDALHKDDMDCEAAKANYLTPIVCSAELEGSPAFVEALIETWLKPCPFTKTALLKEWDTLVSTIKFMKLDGTQLF